MRYFIHTCGPHVYVKQHLVGTKKARDVTHARARNPFKCAIPMCSIRFSLLLAILVLLHLFFHLRRSPSFTSADSSSKDISFLVAIVLPSIIRCSLQTGSRLKHHATTRQLFLPDTVADPGSSHCNNQKTAQARSRSYPLAALHNSIITSTTTNTSRMHLCRNTYPLSQVELPLLHWKTPRSY